MKQQQTPQEVADIYLHLARKWRDMLDSDIPYSAAERAGLERDIAHCLRLAENALQQAHESPRHSSED